METVQTERSVSRLQQYRLLHDRKWCAHCSFPTTA